LRKLPAAILVYVFVGYQMVSKMLANVPQNECEPWQIRTADNTLIRSQGLDVLYLENNKSRDFDTLTW
jgi:hypothetical protein